MLSSSNSEFRITEEIAGLLEENKKYFGPGRQREVILHKAIILKNYEKVCELLKKISSSNLSYINEIMHEVYLHRASLYIGLMGKVKTEGELESLKLYFINAVSLWELSKDEAEKQLEEGNIAHVCRIHKLIPFDPVHAKTWLQKVTYLIDERKPKKWQDILSKERITIQHAIETKTISPSSYDAAVKHIENQEFKEAAHCLDRALIDHSKDKLKKLDCSILLAYCGSKIKESSQDIIKKYRSALDQLTTLKNTISPWYTANWIVYLEGGLVYLNNNDNKNALKEFKNALSSPNYFKKPTTYPILDPNETLNVINERIFINAEKAWENKQYQLVIDLMTVLVDLNKKPNKILDKVKVNVLLAKSYAYLNHPKKVNECLANLISLKMKAELLNCLKEEIDNIKQSLQKKPVPEVKKPAPIIDTLVTAVKPKIIFELTPEEIEQHRKEEEIAQKKKAFEKEKLEKEMQRKKEELEKIRQEETRIKEELAKEKIIEVREREAQKREAFKEKKKETPIKKKSRRPKEITLKKSEEEVENLPKIIPEKPVHFLPLPDKLVKKRKTKKIKKSEIISENKQEVPKTNKTPTIIKTEFDKKTAEEKIARESQVNRIKNPHEKNLMELKELVLFSAKPRQPRKNALEQLGILDIAMRLRQYPKQFNRIIHEIPLLNLLEEMKKEFDNHYMLKLCKLELAIQGSSVFSFALTYWGKIKHNFSVKDVDIFIMKVPYKTSRPPSIDKAAPGERLKFANMINYNRWRSHNLANAALEYVLNKMGFIFEKGKKHFDNYRHATQVNLGLTVCRTNYKSNNLFPFTGLTIPINWPLKANDLLEAVENARPLVFQVINTNTIDCYLITPGMQNVTKYFSRLLKYQEIIQKASYGLGKNFITALTDTKYQVDFFLQKFKETDETNIPSRHFNYLELADVIKSGYLTVDGSATFSYAFTLLRSFCQATYDQYHDQVNDLGSISNRMANILVLYYNRYTQNVDTFYYAIQLLLKNEKLLLENSIADCAEQLYLDQQPFHGKSKHSESQVTSYQDIPSKIGLFSPTKNNKSEFEEKPVKKHEYGK